MTTKTDFAPEAWQAILAAPGAIGTLVMNASFGLGDMIKEAGALSQQIDALVQQPGDLPLLVALAADYKQKQAAEKAQAAKSAAAGAKPATPATPAPEKQDPAAQKAQQMAGLQATVAALDATATPQEAAQLKQWLYGVGDAVAKAAKEGDFFGIGGQQVSAAETAILVEIKTALGL